MMSWNNPRSSQITHQDLRRALRPRGRLGPIAMFVDACALWGVQPIRTGYKMGDQDVTSNLVCCSLAAVFAHCTQRSRADHQSIAVVESGCWRDVLSGPDERSGLYARG